MSGIVVQNTVTDPIGAPYAEGWVHITLITGTPGGAGYTSTGEIISTATVQTDASGHWSATLTPNNQIQPSGTYYQIAEGQQATSAIVVPDSGGPYNLSQLLVATPASPAPLGMTGLQVANAGAVVGSRPELNLLPGTGMTIGVTDNPGSNRIDVTLSSAGAVSSVNNQTGAVTITAAGLGAIPATAEGAPSGVATLDASGHLTSGQDANLLKTSQLGAAGGVASLDGSGHLTAAQAALLLTASNNLGDVPNPSLARGNLGLGAAATAALPLSIANGGTGSATQSFVDLTTAQNIAGVKSFTSPPTGPTPVGSTDLVNKAYADAIALGLPNKLSAQEATVAPLPANTYNNGASGVGATLTATANGALVVDGITVAAGDRVLVLYEAAAANNGLYVVTATGSAGAPYVLTRSTDMNTPAQVPGTFVFVEQGAVNAASGWVVAAKGPFVIGTTAIAFTQFSGAGEILAGTGLTKTGNTISLNGPVSIANGGTGAGTQQAALNALAGAVTAGRVLRGDGTNVSLAALQAGDLPTATTAAQGAVQFDNTAADLQPNGVAALNAPAGPTGKTVDAGHVHPLQPWQFLITKYGAVGDLNCVVDGVMNSGSAVLTSATGAFTAQDVNKAVVVKGAMSSGQTSLIGVISSYQSPTQVTLSVAATASITGAQVLWGTDNTAAIQAAINAALAYQSPFGIGTEVITPPATLYGFMVAGALKNSDGVNAIYNSQLTIGIVSGRAAQRTLSFVGTADAGSCRYWDQDYPFFQSSTWFSAGAFISLSAQQASITAGGNPSVLGGPTGKFGYGTSATDPTYNNITVILRDMAIMTTHSASGWTYSPFNFHGMARAHLDRCSFGTNGVVQYYKNQPGLGDFATVTSLASGVSIGGLMPSAGNNASNRIRDCVWNGGYTYGPLWTEHTVGEGVNTILYCWGGFCPVGNYGDGGTGTGALHAIFFGQLAVESCTYHIMPWGAGSGGVGPEVHGVLDTEGTLQFRGQTHDGVALSAMCGEVRLAGAASAITVDVGSSTGANGGMGLTVIKEKQAKGVQTSGQPALTAGTPAINTYWRFARVFLSGGTGVTTVQISSLAGGTTATMTTVLDFTSTGTIPVGTCVPVPPGCCLQINGATVMPTATWVLD